MANRDGGGGFIWFVIGVLAGVAATLSVLIFFGGRAAQPEAPAPVAAATVSHAPHKVGLRPRPADEAAPPSESPAADDAQVADDAAAAGMTSRSKRQSDH